MSAIKFIIKNHKFICILFFVCCLILIKESELPFLDGTPLIIIKIFSKNSIKGMGELLNGLGYSLFVSIIFYFIIDIIPNYHLQKKGEASVRISINDMYGYIVCITNMLEASSSIQHIDNLDELLIPNNVVYAKCFTNGTFNHYYIYSLGNDLTKNVKLLNSKCREISSAPLFCRCREELIEIINELVLEETICGIANSNVEIQIHHNIANLQKMYSVLIANIMKLKEIFPNMGTYSFVLMNKEEIDDYKKKQNEDMNTIIENCKKYMNVNKS